MLINEQLPRIFAMNNLTSVANRFAVYSRRDERVLTFPFKIESKIERHNLVLPNASVSKLRSTSIILRILDVYVALYTNTQHRPSGTWKAASGSNLSQVAPINRQESPADQ